MQLNKIKVRGSADLEIFVINCELKRHSKLSASIECATFSLYLYF